MSDYPLSEVRSLLTDKHGIRAAKITPEARILHDLGVDGDDAAELFEDLHARFGTDFSALNGHWQEFFNNEGVSPRAMLIGCPAIFIIGGGSGALVAYAHLPNFVGWILVLATLITLSWSFSRWSGREHRALTVGGLAEIVRRGEWPIDPSKVR